MENDKKIALSMFLSSVDHGIDDDIYLYKDITRSGTLAMVADEIKVRGIQGEIAELGVAYGDFSKLMNKLFPEKKIYLFDTFEGFNIQDCKVEQEKGYSSAREGVYSDTSVEKVLKVLPHPEKAVVRKGFFPNSAKGLEEKYCLVSIDCDLYQPIYEGLVYFYPRIVKGGYIFVHDYRSRYYRGVREALMRFSDEQGISYVVLPDNTGTAIIVK